MISWIDVFIIVLAILVTAGVVTMEVFRKKRGKSGCGDCSSCANCSKCQTKKEK